MREYLRKAARFKLCKTATIRKFDLVAFGGGLLVQHCNDKIMSAMLHFAKRSNAGVAPYPTCYRDRRVTDVPGMAGCVRERAYRTQSAVWG